MSTIHVRMPRSARKLSSIGERRIMAVERFDDGLAYAFIALVLAAPLCYGAVEDWAVFTLQFLLAMLALLWVVRKSLVHDDWSLKSPLLLPALLMAGVALLQTIALSSYRHASRQRFLYVVALALALWLCSNLFDDRIRTKRLVWTLVVFGALVALFAIAQYLTGTQKIYWIRQPRDFGVIFGPYVNHAHYAGLMEMLAPFPIVLALSHRYDMGLRALLAFAGALMGVSIFLSGSRGGLVAFSIQLAFLAFVVLRTRQQVSRTKLLAVAGSVVAVILALFAWLASAQIRDSFLALKDPTAHMVGGFRLQILRDSVAMFFERPLFGWGLGTFEFAFPRFQRFYSDFLVNFAHNDYLQLAVEAGVAGLAILVFFFVRFVKAARSGLGRWSHESLPAAKLAALTGCIGIFVHSLFDFNMHVPANALMFVVVATIATNQIHTERVSHRA